MTSSPNQRTYKQRWLEHISTGKLDLRWHLVAAIAHHQGWEESAIALVDEAIMPLLSQHPQQEVEKACGLWKDRTDIGDGVKYQQKLRDEWSEQNHVQGDCLEIKVRSSTNQEGPYNAEQLCPICYSLKGSANCSAVHGSRGEISEELEGELYALTVTLLGVIADHAWNSKEPLHTKLARHLRPYTHTREPVSRLEGANPCPPVEQAGSSGYQVSVSLEKCAIAASQWFNGKDCGKPMWEGLNAQNKLTYKTQARAVLDAAGVAYE